MNDSMFDSRIRLGMEPIKDTDIPTFDQMREAIYQGSRDSHLVRQVLDTANYRGLSGEDKYVLLAYQALLHLEDVHKRLMRMVSLAPPSPILMKASDVPNLIPPESTRS